jgi:hypothetical protein
MWLDNPGLNKWVKLVNDAGFNHENRLTDSNRGVQDE